MKKNGKEIENRKKERREGSVKGGQRKKAKEKRIKSIDYTKVKGYDLEGLEELYYNNI